MPCPLFEPRRKVDYVVGRVPLFEAFEGVCHADDHVCDSALCNQGNAKGKCASFPNDHAISAIRFTVTARTDESLSLLVMEEENYWPRAWQSYDFVIGEERFAPEIEDVCRRAQVFHFCKGFLNVRSHG